MKKILLFLIFILAFSGCAKKETLSQVTSSNPVFFENKPQNKSVFVDIKNSSTLNADLQNLISKNLYEKGYSLSKEKLASSVVKGDFNFFETPYKNNQNVFMNVGFGVGSGGYSSSGLGIGMIFGDSSNDKKPIFGQIALNLTVKTKGKNETHSTVLNLKTSEQDEAKAAEIFAKKIADKIDMFLNF